MKFEDAERYRIHIFCFFRKLVTCVDEVEDLTQETFIRVFRYFPRYNQGLEFRPWLYRIATCVYIDHIKNKKKLPDNAEWDENDPPVSEEQTANVEFWQLIKFCVEALTFRQRRILELKWEGVSNVSIAESLGCSEGTVRAELITIGARVTRILEEK